NFDWSLRWSRIRALLGSVGLCNFRITEAALTNGSICSTVGRTRRRDAITEPGARDCPLRSIPATSAIAGARTNRKIERPEACDICDLAGLPLAFHSVRITKSTRLDLRRRQIGRRLP